VGRTRLVMHTTFVQISLLKTSETSAHQRCYAQGCWCVRIRRYAGLSKRV